MTIMKDKIKLNKKPNLANKQNEFTTTCIKVNIQTGKYKLLSGLKRIHTIFF